MNWLEKRTFKAISTIILFLFCWVFAGGYDLAFAVKNSDQLSGVRGQQKQRKQKTEDKFQKTLDEIQKIVEEVSKSESLEDKKDKKKSLKDKKAEIGKLDKELKEQFNATEQKLKDAKLPQEILQRHYDFVKQYEENLKELLANIDEIDNAQNDFDIDKKAEKTRKFLEKVKPKKKHTPLDPNKLPHRTPDTVFKEPRLNKEQFLEDRKALRVTGDELKVKTNYPLHITNHESLILVASAGSLNGLLDLPIPNLESQDPALLFQDVFPIPNSEFENPNLLLAQASTPPSSADLAETIEVQFTPEIIAKALELENNPAKIYNWVRNNIEFVPTYGSIQGANYCLQTKLCNAFDTASLLIALLRVSGIPARYVEGTVEIPIEKVMNWVGGFTDANAALTLIASGGIPGTILTSGGQIVAAQMEHIWVETYVPYGPYSGRPSKLNHPKTWIPLDPSFKQYTYTEGIDLQTIIPFDAQGFIEQIQSTATINEAESYVTNVDSNYIQTTMTDYQNQLQNYIDQNMPDATVEDILGKKEIKKQELGILPVTLPYKRIVTGDRYSEIPDNLRHKVTFTVNDPYLFETSLSYTASIPALVEKRITLSYAPATLSDEQTINSYGGIYNSPVYLVNMKPQLKVEGIVEATGGSIGLGNQQTFGMKFSGPNINTDIVSNNITAGAYYGIGFNPNKIPKELIEQRRVKLESVKDTINQSNIYTDDYIGELLYTTAIVYFFELDVFEDIIAQSYNIAKVKQVSEGIVAKDLLVSYLFSVPIKAEEGGLIIDVDRNIYSPVSKSGDNIKSQEFMITSGQMGSGMEHGIFEQMYNKTGTSAIKALSVANSQGIPIYSIDASNIADVLPVLQVSNDVKADIINGVNAGKVVTISKTNVTVDTWTGVGYIISDPDSGAAAYMISGGFAGGGADLDLPEIVIKYFEVIHFLDEILAFGSILLIPLIIIIFTIIALGVKGALAALGLALLGIGIAWLIAAIVILLILGIFYLITGIDNKERWYAFKKEPLWKT